MEIVLKIYTHLWFGFSVVPVIQIFKEKFYSQSFILNILVRLHNWLPKVFFMPGKKEQFFPF